MKKRPANSPNYANRRSNLTSKNDRWKEQLVQGTIEREREEKTQLKIKQDIALQKERKSKCKNEAKQLDIQYGFTDIEQEKQYSLPEWKKQKLFLKSIFPDSVICTRYQDQEVFKSKSLMQEFLRRVVTIEEWENNLSLLAEMRRIYDCTFEVNEISTSVSN